MNKFYLSLTAIVALTACSTKPPAKDPAEPPLTFISEMRPLTVTGLRAGEGYFSADGKWLIFQSEREAGNPFYQMYVMNWQTNQAHRVSPGFGKATCGWIHPSNQKVLFSSTHQDLNWKKKAEAEWAERKSPKSRYSWNFDEAYDIFEARISGQKNPKNLTNVIGYDAEASYSPDGKWIAFASNRSAFQKKLSPDERIAFQRDPSLFMDLYIMKADGSEVRQLTHTLGYDGGPFFSPDGRRLTFRRFTADGKSADIYTIGVDGQDERRLTDFDSMSWAPFYHPSGAYIIFASNKLGHANFELFIVDVEGKHKPVQVSYQTGFDGLPAFSPDGATLIWSHTPSHHIGAQLFQAQWNDRAARQALGLNR